MLRDLPGVGENLQDHLEFYFQVRLHAAGHAVFIDGLARTRANRCALAAVQERTRRDQPFRDRRLHPQSGDGVTYPDIQFHFLPLAVTYDGSSLAKEHGFQAHVGPMRSKSRGSVRLASPDARDAPRILFNYLSHPDDLAEIRAGLRLAREICSRRKPSIRIAVARSSRVRTCGRTTRSMPSCGRRWRAPITRPAPARWAPPADPMAVVDPQARVIGVEGLRVVDSSIMPSITTGNLNAPTIMLAEKAVDHILGKSPLPPSAPPGPLPPPK